MADQTGRVFNPQDSTRKNLILRLGEKDKLINVTLTFVAPP